jgi:hypothetical protein
MGEVYTEFEGDILARGHALLGAILHKQGTAGMGMHSYTSTHMFAGAHS